MPKSQVTDKGSDLLLKSDNLEFNLNPKDAIIVERHFLGKTHRDIEIESLTIPSSPLFINLIIKAIRLYQKKLSTKIGNRCVFDPSCSHYSEVAFRKKGLIKGSLLTIKRLYRCRPANGGVDELV